MGKSYGSEPVHLKKAELTEPMFLAIGKLVRAMAEIEDMVDLHICNLVGLSESQTMVILGRTAVTRKLEIAERLALLRDDAAIQVHKSVFDDNYNDLVNCRNAVAHGTLMGEANGKLYFLASPSGLKPNEGRAPRDVFSFTPEQIAHNAEVAQGILPHVEQRLQVGELRAERLQRPLKPHPKGLAQAGAKPQRPPQSSQT